MKDEKQKVGIVYKDSHSVVYGYVKDEPKKVITAKDPTLAEKALLAYLFTKSR